MNKEERIKRLKFKSSMQRKELFLKKMKEKGIKMESKILINHGGKEIHELIHISDCFTELREKNKSDL